MTDYLSGFGNGFESEALPGGLCRHQRLAYACAHVPGGFREFQTRGFSLARGLLLAPAALAGGFNGHIKIETENPR